MKFFKLNKNKDAQKKWYQITRKIPKTSTQRKQRLTFLKDNKLKRVKEASSVKDAQFSRFSKQKGSRLQRKWDKKKIAIAVGFIFVVGTALVGNESEEQNTQPPTEERVVAESVESSSADAELLAIQESKDKMEIEKKEAADQAIQESKELADKQKKEEAEKAASEEKEEQKQRNTEIETERLATQEVPPSVPDGEFSAEVNGNIPFFTNEDISSTEAWEEYGELDEWYRVTPANAVLGVELMPAEERGSISNIIPTGWDQRNYDVVSGGWLYNRSHLIGFQLTGENDNEKNLMTGTRWFNAEGMLPYENFVANYIEETENHVRYRVTPYFEGDNLLATGLYMEGFSIEDNGEGLSFNIYVPNIQPGVGLDYATGNSWLLDAPVVVEEPIYEESVAEEVYEEPVYEEVYEEPATDAYYQNCTDVRNAGAAPIRAGDPGWQSKFDRDGDGVGCE